MTRGYQTVSYYFSFNSQRILVIFHINLLINKNICRWLVNWNVQFSGWLWNVSGNTLHFFLIKCSHGASFKNEKDKWQTIRKHQYIMWQRQVWDLEFWRIFQNILKFFSKVWNTIRWPFCKTGKIFRCFQLILLPFKNTHYVIVPIRTVVQKTQFHFVVNMHKNHFYKTKKKL